MDDTQKDGSIWGNGLGRRTLITGAAAAAFGLTLGDMMGLSNGSLAFAAGAYGTVVWPTEPHPAPDPTYGQQFDAPRWYGRHTGSDYVVPANTPIRAVADGVVTESEKLAGDAGNCVGIRHANFSTRYLHMIRPPSVAKDARVTAGQIIGYVGSTGSSTVNHLHLDVRLSSGLTDPHAWLKANVGPGSTPPTERIEVPDYSLVRGQNDNRVYLSVNRLQRRWIESEAALADVRYVLRGVGAPAADRAVEVVANPDAYGVIITATPTLDQIRQVIREEVAAGK
jgi:murein DD-endopeptidase MepM/ murein hydrolase activator NlpD